MSTGRNGSQLGGETGRWSKIHVLRGKVEVEKWVGMNTTAREKGCNETGRNRKSIVK